MVALLDVRVPFDVAWNMVEAGMWAEITAYIVAAGEMKGGKFDWGQMAWLKD